MCSPQLRTGTTKLVCIYDSSPVRWFDPKVTCQIDMCPHIKKLSKVLERHKTSTGKLQQCYPGFQKHVTHRVPV